MARNRRHAPPPHPDTEEIRRKNREEARKSAEPPRNVEAVRRKNREDARKSAEPPRNVEEIRRKNREDARKCAEPGERPQRDECCGKSLFRVTSGRVVHGAKKGDVVELCESGATRALVQAGHLVPVDSRPDPEPPESEAATVTADTEKEANDG